MTQPTPAFILAADWSKHSAKRAVYEANVRDRRISRVASSSWDLASLLNVAKGRAEHGAVLIALDLALGLPEAYWSDAVRSCRDAKPEHFLDWLASLNNAVEFWTEAKSTAEWSVQRPFYAVPKGQGAMKAFYAKAGYDFDRRIDKRCRSNPLFCVSGIPGTVGSGTRSFWQELSPLLNSRREFRIWPFDGSLRDLLKENNVVLAEMYPGIAYTVALREHIPGAVLNVAKTKPTQRQLAIEMFAGSTWVDDLSVTLENLDDAQESEDDFDALISAASLLRCVLEDRTLDEPETDDPVCEGGILLTSAVDFSSKRQRLINTTLERNKKHTPRSTAVTKPSYPQSLPTAKVSTRPYECPIAGCTKVYRSGRSGWDGHIGSLRMHPQWHPEVKNPVERKRLFKQEFPGW